MKKKIQALWIQNKEHQNKQNKKKIINAHIFIVLFFFTLTSRRRTDDSGDKTKYISLTAGQNFNSERPNV